jgi:multicomponent Na+:H+ antiporter subunit C
VKELLEKVVINYPYLAAGILFAIGVLTVLTRSNVFKKLIGINIMESSVFLLFVSAGNIKGGNVPILDTANPKPVYVNPLPSALMLVITLMEISRSMTVGPIIALRSTRSIRTNSPTRNKSMVSPPLQLHFQISDFTDYPPAQQITCGFFSKRMN